jgi:hypothetical protein
MGKKVVNMMRDRCCCREEGESFRKGVDFYYGFFSFIK